MERDRITSQYNIKHKLPVTPMIKFLNSDVVYFNGQRY